MRPWYFRWWGMMVIGYVAITGMLGIVVLASDRSVPSGPTALDAIRAGGFTEAKGVDAAARADAPLVTDADPAIGSPTPLLTIVEFSDFECPFCREAFPTIRALATRYGDRVRFVYRDFPVDELHAGARLAAEAAQCAHGQGKFWAYHDKLFQSAPRFDRAALSTYARAVGLDVAAFDACVDGKQFTDAVEMDAAAGRAFGVKGTPTWFFLLGNDPKTARRVEGVIPSDVFDAVVADTLARVRR